MLIGIGNPLGYSLRMSPLFDTAIFFLICLSKKKKMDELEIYYQNLYL
jgi:hypothetical protein